MFTTKIAKIDEDKVGEIVYLHLLFYDFINTFYYYDLEFSSVACFCSVRKRYLIIAKN